MLSHTSHRTSSGVTCASGVRFHGTVVPTGDGAKANPPHFIKNIFLFRCAKKPYPAQNPTHRRQHMTIGYWTMHVLDSVQLHGS